MPEVEHQVSRLPVARNRWLQTTGFCAVGVALVAAWISFETARARRHEQVVDQLIARGATVLYNYQESGGTFVFGAKPFYPRWWRDLTARHFGVHVVELTLLQADPDDDLLQFLKPLEQLRTLALDNCHRVSNAGLQSLQNLTGLAELSLSHTRISGTGLAHLQGLSGLRVLRLNSTAVNDASLRHLRRMVNLQILELGSTRISNSGVAHLANLTDLRRLGLQNTLVGNEALAYLAQLTNLESLELSRTQVSPEGVAWLRQRLPDCQIYCQFLSRPIPNKLVMDPR